MIRNSRFFLRPVEDVEAGGMTSVHSQITLKKGRLRGELHIRDCENQISLEFWTGKGARPGGVLRMTEALTLLREEIDEFITDYETASLELEE